MKERDLPFLWRHALIRVENGDLNGQSEFKNFLFLMLNRAKSSGICLF